MPDCTMCVSATCPLFATCYRAQAEPNPYRQSYAKFEIDGCEYYNEVVNEGESK